MKQLVAVNVHTVVPSPVGDLILVACDDALVGLYMAGQKHLPDDEHFGAQRSPRSLRMRGRSWMSTSQESGATSSCRSLRWAMSFA